MSSNMEMTASKPLYENRYVFNYDWGAVTAAWLEKFPDPNLKQVKSVETVGYVYNRERETMHLRRLFHCSFNIPKLVEKLLGERVSVVCVEEAHWDIGRRQLTVYGRNETFRHIVSIDEVCTYTEESPGKTIYTQSATVNYRKGLLSGIFMPLATELVSMIASKNTEKGIAAMVARTAGVATGSSDRPVNSHTPHTQGYSKIESNTAVSPALLDMQMALGFGALVATTGYFAMNLFATRWNRDE
mmetsp:Transcript_121737/g.191045  ORF Transcript_121737/g.191045 Transcript_121737/m.191045 type:complete len:244 (-) Transcript_121737:59-790(-)